METPENQAASNARRKSQRNGATFEGLFKFLCESIGLGLTRIPDGCRVAGFDPVKKMPRLVRVKSPWDWLVSFGRRCALLDTKSQEGSSFQYSKINEDQVREMVKHEHPRGTVAGYVVWLKGSSRLVFIPARALAEKLGARGSFKLGDPGVVDLGELVDQPRSAKVNFRGIFDFDEASERLSGVTLPAHLEQSVIDAYRSNQLGGPAQTNKIIELPDDMAKVFNITGSDA